MQRRRHHAGMQGRLSAESKVALTALTVSTTAGGDRPQSLQASLPPCEGLDQAGCGSSPMSASLARKCRQSTPQSRALYPGASLQPGLPLDRYGGRCKSETLKELSLVDAALLYAQHRFPARLRICFRPGRAMTVESAGGELH